MNHFFIVFIVFWFSVSPINGQGACATGDYGSVSCKIDPCGPNTICYRVEDGEKGMQHFCCGRLEKFCPTKMHSLHSEAAGSFLWLPVKSAETIWYNVKLENAKVACPFPYSFAYSGNDQLKVLPVDFDASKPESSKPKACNINSDCNTDKDEFCGSSSHPTYPNKLDKSGKFGTPLKFCYKFQNSESDVKPIISADQTELTGCNDNSGCSSVEGGETVCFIKENLTPVQLAEKNNKVTRMQGFCAFHPKTGSSWWWNVLIGSIVSTVICLVMSIVFYIAFGMSAPKEEPQPSSSIF